jgi:hypothetical protein
MIGAPTVALPKQPSLELLDGKPNQVSLIALRFTFWSLGLVLASAQAWIFRYEVSADSISYFDMSDGVLHGYDWHRLINGMYSGLYPFLLGVFRRTFHISPGNEIADAHLFGVVLFVFAFACFEFFLAAAVRELESQTLSSTAGRHRLLCPSGLSFQLRIASSYGRQLNTFRSSFLGRTCSCPVSFIS